MNVVILVQKEISGLLGEEAVYFTMMRHPVEAVISLYDKHVPNKIMSLEDLLQKLMKGEQDEVFQYGFETD